MYAHLKSTFHRIIYRLVRRLHLFFYLLYIYQLTRVNFSLSRFACLSLYKNALLLSHVPSFSRFLLRLHFLRLRRHFHPNEKKISHDLNLKKKKKIDVRLCDRADLRSALGDSRDATVAPVTR